MTTQEQFIKTVLPYAQAAESKYKVPALVAMARSALETGWGKNAPGNMYFGIKASKKWTGKKQLLTTTEFHDTPDVQYPVIINIEKVKIKVNGKEKEVYKYKVKDYFRAYDSPQGSFDDFGKFLNENARYKNAFQFSDPVLFTKEIVKAGYSTASNTFETLQVLIQQIKKKAEQLQLL